MPLYAYEHMLGYAVVLRHVANEITLLCDRHHREKTAGLLSSDAVAAANADPCNLRAERSSPYLLHYSGDSCRAEVGSNVMTASTQSDFVAVMIDGQRIVWFNFEDGNYLLNVRLFDSCNQLVLEVVQNELVYSIDPWDIELVGRRLTIRSAPRNIYIDCLFAPPNGLILERGRILYNGVELFIRPDYLLLVNNCGLMRGNGFGNCVVALNIGVDPNNYPSGIRWSGVPRYETDRQAAIAWAKEQLSGSGIEDATLS
jgi:hypothetical protein